jgi:hypothetical protein
MPAFGGLIVLVPLGQDGRRGRRNEEFPVHGFQVFVPNDNGRGCGRSPIGSYRAATDLSAISDGGVGAITSFLFGRTD